MPTPVAAQVRYHYGPDRVTCSNRVYSKEGAGHQVVQVDSFSRALTDQALLDEFTRLQVRRLASHTASHPASHPASHTASHPASHTASHTASHPRAPCVGPDRLTECMRGAAGAGQAAEREIINEIKDYDRQTKEILKRRSIEESDIEEAEEEAARLSPGSKPLVPRYLEVSVYDTARSRLANAEDEEDPDADKVPHDYLTPFLADPIGVNDPPLSRDEALQAREACLRSLKDRLVERANIVQSRLDEENAALSKKQAAFQRNRDHMDPADEHEYERYCQEAMFRIQILEQRLDRHTELSLQKYAEMDARLRDDPRLKNLNTSR